MKRIIVFMFCILFVCANPSTVSAESTSLPSEESEAATGETNLDETYTLISVKFKEWVLPHLEEISVVITLIGSLIYEIRKNRALAKSMGTMNNNTVAIAEQNANMMIKALSGMENVSNIVTAYDARIAALLEAHQSTAEEKELLEKELTEIKTYLKTSAESNIEFANELAELLGLANIPNYKKEEIGARHLAAVKSIRTAETDAILPLNAKEVKENDGEKA